jgi:hypothetical protein
MILNKKECNLHELDIIRCDEEKEMVYDSIKQIKANVSYCIE